MILDSVPKTVCLKERFVALHKEPQQQDFLWDRVAESALLCYNIYR